MVNEQNNENRILIIGIVSTLVLVILVIFALCNYSVCKNEFSIDVMNSYICNLYGTQRFSAVPIIDVPIMVFLYTHILLFLCKKNKKKQLSIMFIVITSIIIVYILIIGEIYINSWAAKNIQDNGEYLTGFETYMVIPTITIYAYWIYVLLMKR